MHQEHQGTDCAGSRIENVLSMMFNPTNACFLSPTLPVKSTMTDESNILHEKSMSSVLQTATLILKDSAPEIMGIFMVVCLAAFLSSKEHVKLTSFPYLVATMFLPLQLALFFQKPTIGCIEVIQTDDATAILRRKFPISVVFHAIATLCCMLMEHQMRVRNGDIRDIRNLRIKINEKVQEKRKTK